MAVLVVVLTWIVNPGWKPATSEGARFALLGSAVSGIEGRVYYPRDQASLQLGSDPVPINGDLSRRLFDGETASVTVTSLGGTSLSHGLNDIEDSTGDGRPDWMWAYPASQPGRYTVDLILTSAGTNTTIGHSTFTLTPAPLTAKVYYPKSRSSVKLSSTRVPIKGDFSRKLFRGESVHVRVFAHHVKATRHFLHNVRDSNGDGRPDWMWAYPASQPGRYTVDLILTSAGTNTTIGHSTFTLTPAPLTAKVYYPKSRSSVKLSSTRVPIKGDFSRKLFRGESVHVRVFAHHVKATRHFLHNVRDSNGDGRPDWMWAYPASQPGRYTVDLILTSAGTNTTIGHSTFTLTPPPVTAGIYYPQDQASLQLGSDPVPINGDLSRRLFDGETASVTVTSPGGTSLSHGLNDIEDSTGDGRPDWMWAYPASQPGRYTVDLILTSAGTNTTIGHSTFTLTPPPVTAGIYYPQDQASLQLGSDPVPINGDLSRRLFDGETASVTVTSPGGTSLSYGLNDIEDSTGDGRPDWMWAYPASQPGRYTVDLILTSAGTNITIGHSTFTLTPPPVTAGIYYPQDQASLQLGSDPVPINGDLSRRLFDGETATVTVTSPGGTSLSYGLNDIEDSTGDGRPDWMWAYPASQPGRYTVDLILTSAGTNTTIGHSTFTLT